MKRVFSVIISVFALSLTLMPNAFAADTSAPKLEDFTIQNDVVVQNYTVDISKSDAPVKVRFIISDDSEIALPNLLIKSLSTTQMTAFATVKELSRSGKLISYEATAIIKVGQSPRDWEWVLYPLKDVLGNSSSGFGPGDSWESKITVTDLEYTRGILSCERNYIRWNSKVQEFIDNEKRLNYPQEFAIARLKSKTPVEIFDPINCTNKQYDSISFWEQLNELYFLLEMTLEAYNERQERETERINSELIAQMELKQKENEKQAAVDKALADVKAAADKAAGEKIIADAKAEAARILVAAKAAAAKKKTTITCFKGKSVKKVTAVKPVCPKGYKKK